MAIALHVYTLPALKSDSLVFSVVVIVADDVIAVVLGAVGGNQDLL